MPWPHSVGAPFLLNVFAVHLSICSEYLLRWGLLLRMPHSPSPLDGVSSTSTDLVYKCLTTDCEERLDSLDSLAEHRIMHAAALSFSTASMLAMFNIIWGLPTLQIHETVSEKAKERVKRGDEKKREELIWDGMVIDWEDREGNTMIFYTAKEGHLSLIQCLVEDGGNVKKSNNKGLTPLHLASQNGDNRVVEYLLTQHINREERQWREYDIILCRIQWRLWDSGIVWRDREGV